MGRKKKNTDELVETIGAGLYPPEVLELDRLAKQYRWTRAYVSGLLIRLGLSVYKRTGSFEDIGDITQKSNDPISKMPPKPSQTPQTENE